jgi:hypothetical protein
MRRHPWLLLVFMGFLVWDYEPHPALSLFLMYAHLPGDAYDWEHPTWMVVAVEESFTLEIDCSLMTLSSAGPWTAVLKAFGGAGQQSPASNEITFYWSSKDGCTDTAPEALPPPAPRPPPPPIVPVPPVVVLPSPPPSAPVLPPPLVKGPSGPPSTNCMLTGTCGGSTPSRHTWDGTTPSGNCLLLGTCR